MNSCKIIFLITLAILGAINCSWSQNAVDANGKRVGPWVIYGTESKEANFPAEAKFEEGEYLNGRKNGIWKRYWPNGNVRSEIEYKNGRASGLFTTFYENGNLEEKGNMVGGKLKGTYELFYANGQPKQQKFFNEAGETDGKVVYYYDNGVKELEFETSNGVENGKATWFFKNGDVKKEKVFNNGVVDSTKEYERVNPPFKDPNPEPVIIAPTVKGKENEAQKDKKEIVDGYHKTYDDNKNLLMDGEFKNGRLFNGRHYIYDEFGLLDHIEVYKEGVFAGNGVIGAKDKY